MLRARLPQRRFAALLWWLASLPIALSITAPIAASGPAAASPLPPNILVLMAEDLSARVAAFADPLARTPNLDRLAADGVRFPNTFTTAGVCAPSRAAFITGVHQISLGAQHMRTSTAPGGGYLAVPAPEIKAFPELLRQAGYYTFTDNKLDYQFSGIRAGSGPFTIWDAQGSDSHYRNRRAQQPFFGLINFLSTHESATFTVWSQVKAGNWLGMLVASSALAARASLPHSIAAENVAVPPYYPDVPAVRQEIARLYNNVQVMDAEVGAILADLKTAGLLDNTIIIWTTDHGDALPRAKRELFDSGIRVPMIIRWPDRLRPAGLDAGTLDSRLISFIDLAPLILELAGVELPKFLQGRTPFAGTPRQYIHASRDRVDEQEDRVRAVRDQQFKYLRYYRPGTPGAYRIAYREAQETMQALWQAQSSGQITPAQAAWFAPRPEEALYDVTTDPHELNNLAGNPAYAADLTRLRSALGAWRLRVADLGEISEDKLAQRFWPDGRQPVTPPPTIEVDRNGLLHLQSSSPGASLGYRLDDADWQLYRAPVAVAAGQSFVAKAVRYGWAESTEVRWEGRSAK